MEMAAIKMLRFYENTPNCFEKDNKKGHFTGSAWVVSPNRDSILMTHHKQLNMWLQLGGHADGKKDLIEVANREAIEESGIDSFRLLNDEIFDLDIHEFPSIKKNPKHLHYDVRFLLEADPEKNKIIVSSESHDVKWIPIDNILDLNPEQSIQRMVQKTLAIKK